MNEQRTFTNNVKILYSLDQHEVPFLQGQYWQRFSSDPVRYLIRADDETADAIWAAVVKRQPQKREAA